MWTVSTIVPRKFLGMKMGSGINVDYQPLSLGSFSESRCDQESMWTVSANIPGKILGMKMQSRIDVDYISHDPWEFPRNEDATRNKCGLYEPIPLGKISEWKDVITNHCGLDQRWSLRKISGRRLPTRVPGTFLGSKLWRGVNVDYQPMSLAHFSEWSYDEELVWATNQCPWHISRNEATTGSYSSAEYQPFCGIWAKL